MGKKPIKEADFIRPIQQLFPKSKYQMLSEVPFNGKHIDLLFLSKETRKLIAIEMKVKKWKRALRQAAVYQLCANMVYIALWCDHINEDNKEEITNRGLGLISIERGHGDNLKAKIVAGPKRTGMINKKHSREMRERFEETEK